MSDISHFIARYDGAVLFVIAFAEQCGVPSPGAPWFLAAGALAADGQVNLIIAIFWATVGSIAADVFWFCAGHRAKARLFRLFPHWHSIWDVVTQKTHTSLVLRGIQMLTAAKFLPIGILVPMRAGALDADPVRFLLVDAFCSLFYAAFYILPGFFLHDQLQQVVSFFGKLGGLTVPTLVVALGVYLCCEYVRHRRRKASESGTDGLTNAQASCASLQHR